jgi:hypothetical protein
MKFKEYYRLHEDTYTYILMKNGAGQYQVIGPRSAKELPAAMQSAKSANNPVGMWTYNISNGQLHLPPELEEDKENILRAHYARMGLDKPEARIERPEEKQAFGSIIDPDVFDPRYEKRHAMWKRYQAKQGLKQLRVQQPQPQQDPGTIDYIGNPLASGMPTPPPRRT